MVVKSTQLKLSLFFLVRNSIFKYNFIRISGLRRRYITQFKKGCILRILTKGTEN